MRAFSALGPILVEPEIGQRAPVGPHNLSGLIEATPSRSDMLSAKPFKLFN